MLHSGGYDIICLTEAYADLLPEPGHLITSTPDYGYPLKPGRRKVILWSRSPWRDVDALGHPELPRGRFVSGTTQTPAGEVRFVGICIPWKDAHVRTGRRDRTPWQDHLSFIHALEEHLLRIPAGLPAIVAGDFNQRLPRSHAPLPVAEALQHMLDGFTVPTAGIIPPIGRQVIDHLAHTRALAATLVRAWPGTRADGLHLSDHDGVSVELVPLDPPLPPASGTDSP